MHCSNCGKEIADKAKFCPECGAAVTRRPKSEDTQPEKPVTQQEAPVVEKETPAVPQVEIPTGSGDAQAKADKKKEPPKKALIILAVAVVVVVAVCAVISMFGGSETGSNTNLPDWLDKIPVISDGGSIIGSDDVEAVESRATEVSYAEMGNAAIALGMPDNDKIKYYQAGGYVGIYNGEIVYSATVVGGDRKNVPLLLYGLPEPLIVKQGDLYVLCYKLENEHDNCYMMFLTTPDDPSTPYLMWAPQFSVDAASAEYCDFLNGKKEMEVVSIPGSNDPITSTSEPSGSSSNNATTNTPEPITPSVDTFDLPEWEGYIPTVPGITAQFDDYTVDSWDGSGLAPYREYGFESVFDFADDDGIFYGESGSYAVAIDAQTGEAMGYGEHDPNPDVPVGSYFQIVLEEQPLIAKDEYDYYLIYKRDIGYEIYRVVQTDSPDYADWGYSAVIYIKDPRCFNYLNGNKDLEVISFPGIGS